MSAFRVQNPALPATTLLDAARMEPGLAQALRDAATALLLTMRAQELDTTPKRRSCPSAAGLPTCYVGEEVTPGKLSGGLPRPFDKAIIAEISDDAEKAVAE